MSEQMVSVILPCYNEKDNILLLIRELHQTLQTWKHQIIVVDDNSPDDTYQVVQNEQLSYVKTILRKDAPSLAKSIRTGIENADGDIIVVMDSDFNHRVEELPIMLTNLTYFDCVSASRFVYGGRMNTRFRHISSWLFNIFVRVITRKFITDNLFGFFAIHKRILEQLDYNKIFWGYGDYCIRLMFYLQKAQINILQVPAVLGERKHGHGNKKLIRIFMQYTKEALKLSFK